MEPIRILMLFTILNRGGAESMVMSYYRNIDRSKVQFDFLVHRQERGAYEDEIEQLGGRIYRLIPFHPFTFGKYKRMVSKFFDEHPEYQIIHGHCSELGYFVYREASRRGIPHIIAHAHGLGTSIDIKWPFRTWFKYRMRKYLTHEFTCGKSAAEWLFGKRLSQEVIFQRNAIDTMAFKYSERNRSQVREEFQISEDTILVGHVGRFDKEKNHVFLIDVFKHFLKLHPNSKLLLIGGTGILESTIRRKVKEEDLTGFVIFGGTRTDVHKILSAMDIFLFPSITEGFGIALLEAQCSGLPCVISKGVAQEALVTDLVHQKSLQDMPIEWAHCILDSLNHLSNREGYDLVIKNSGYDIKQNAEWLQNYYLSLVE